MRSNPADENSVLQLFLASFHAMILAQLRKAQEPLCPRLRPKLFEDYLKLTEARKPSTIPNRVLTHGEPEIIQPDLQPTHL